MISESTIPNDKIEVLPDGQIQIREAQVILRDGVRDLAFAAIYHRYVLAPGDDITGKHAAIIAVASAVWTQDVIEAYRAAQAAATS